MQQVFQGHTDRISGSEKKTTIFHAGYPETSMTLPT
jgi:hypothetical protein